MLPRLTSRIFALSSAILLGGSGVQAEIPVPDEPGVIGYNPTVFLAQGNQPYSESYELKITMPANLVPGVPVTVSLGVIPTSFPDGSSAAAAAGLVTLSDSQVVVSQPSQVVTITVFIDVPVGQPAGGYSWKVVTSGWPPALGTIVDNGGTINGLFSAPGEVDESPPAVTLNSPTNGMVYTYFPTSGSPASVPIDFSAAVGANGQPIQGMSAFIDGVPITLDVTGLGTLAANATATVTYTSAGTHTLEVLASNLNGTSAASSTFSVVVSAPPPTITVASPASGASYSFVLGTPGVSVPVSVSASSVYGNITALGATLNGAPLALSTSGVGTALTATGSALPLITTPGAHELTFTAANDYGLAVPVKVPFEVQGLTPLPTVTIATPADGSVFNREEGDPATVVNFSFSAGTTYGAISSVVVTLDGVVVPAAVTGLNTPGVTGTGFVSFGAGGSHTLQVTVSNGGATATASTAFKVVEDCSVCCNDLTWLPPISLNKTQKGGSKIPIKFRLDCEGKFLRDEKVVIGIYEIFADGSMSNPVLFPYGTGSPNKPEYAITGPMYHLNFETASGKHHYKIEVYTLKSGSPRFIGEKDLFTK
jgi:hypothetical protein